MLLRNHKNLKLSFISLWIILALTNISVSASTNEMADPAEAPVTETTNEVQVSPDSSETPTTEDPALTDESVPALLETEPAAEPVVEPVIIDAKKETPDTSDEKDTHKIAVMGEFGLGNVGSLYGVYGFSLFSTELYIGAGVGYYFYNDKDNDTSINIIEPALVFMKEIQMLVFRIRTGIGFINEERFGFTGSIITISPDVMVQLKGIYAGISMPVLIGDEGTGVAFSIGAGYKYIFNF